MKSRAALEEKLAWMRARQAERAAREEVGASSKRLPSLERIRKQRKAAPARFRMIPVGVLAENFAVSPQTIRRWFADRAKIVVTGKGHHRTFLISEQDVDDFLEAKRAG